MWLLKSSNGNIYYLKPGTITTFGRKSADITVPNDASVSRNHASISVVCKELVKINEFSSTCSIKDTSKYGTSVIRNGLEHKVPVDSHYELLPNDTLKIGLNDAFFKLEYQSIVSSTSRLSEGHQKRLKTIFDEIGGIITDKFDDVNCTHLTVTIAATTDKLILALIAGLPIVNIDYWEAIKVSIVKNEVIPDSKNYIVTLDDKLQSVNLAPNSKRKTLFIGKVFYFFTESQYKMKKRMIKEAGGRAVAFNKISEPNIEELIENKDNIIVQWAVDSESENEESNIYSEICDKLGKLKMRTIPESEIPVAVLYAETERFCNPKYDYKYLIKRKIAPVDNSKVLVMDTQDILDSQTSSSNKRPLNKVIEESQEDKEEEDIVQCSPLNSISRDNEPTPKKLCIHNENGSLNIEKVKTKPKTLGSLSNKNSNEFGKDKIESEKQDEDASFLAKWIDMNSKINKKPSPAKINSNQNVNNKFKEIEDKIDIMCLPSTSRDSFPMTSRDSFSSTSKDNSVDIDEFEKKYKNVLGSSKKNNTKGKTILQRNIKNTSAKRAKKNISHLMSSDDDSDEFDTKKDTNHRTVKSNSKVDINTELEKWGFKANKLPVLSDSSDDEFDSDITNKKKENKTKGVEAMELETIKVANDSDISDEEETDTFEKTKGNGIIRRAISKENNLSTKHDSEDKLRKLSVITPKKEVLTEETNNLIKGDSTSSFTSNVKIEYDYDGANFKKFKKTGYFPSEKRISLKQMTAWRPY